MILKAYSLMLNYVLFFERIIYCFLKNKKANRTNVLSAFHSKKIASLKYSVSNF
jgi:hypothetical protein